MQWNRPAVAVAAAVTILGCTATAASAQCAFERPRKAKKVLGELVQAFLPCDGANTATESGLPSCGPPETFNELHGNPPSGWRWGPRSAGAFEFRSSGNKVVDAMNPPEDSSDVKVQLKLKDIEDVAGDADGTGVLVALLRVTLDDRAGGDMTAVDIPVDFAVDVVGGKAKLKTTVNVFLNDAHDLPGLPACASVEFEFVGVADVNGTLFGVPGILNNVNKVP